MLASVADGKKNNQTYNSSKATEKVNSSKSATALSEEPTHIRPSRVHIVQNFRLIWLDENIDEITNDHCRNIITKLREVVNIVNTCTDADECIDFISNIKEEKVFIVSSGTLGPTMATAIHNMSQVRAIFIFCENKAQHEQWATQWSKVKGVFTDITLICEALKQAARDCDQNAVSMSFVALSSGNSTENLDQLDPTFMYTQLLKEILLSIDFEEEDFVGFITYCREQFVGSIAQLSAVDKLEKEYRLRKPIWWYTCQSFLYSMLNRALRTMEVDIVIKMGFFVRALHEHITQLHSEQYAGRDHSTSFTLYRGQGVSSTDFNQLLKTKGGLMSFNNFLSTSLDRAVSFTFAESNQNDPNIIGVLFQITIDPSISSTPFANIRDLSCYQGEEEILFSMHSIFRIVHINQMDNNPRLWQVDLTLTSDNDPELRTLTERMREEVEGSTGWYRLGKLMIKVGQFNQAQELYEILLQQITHERDEGNIYYQFGLVKLHQGEYMDALTLYEKSLKIRQNILTSEHPDVAECYNATGLVYDHMGDYSKALSSHEKALEIRQKALPENHPDLAVSYDNIGLLYNDIGEYSKALSSHQKAVEIGQQTLPANHPHLANYYNNIGLMYGKMGEYSKALSYFEKATEIYQKTLPANHPDLATSYNNIGVVYAKMGEYPKALSSHEKAMEIYQKTLPANHPDLAISYNNVGSVYDKRGEYSKALSCHEKALEIRQKTLPENHPSLATSYNNMGSVYDKMGEYSKALSYHEKALDVWQKSLSANHPDLACSYEHIGMVSLKLGEHSKAVSYCERALKMVEGSLPASHPYQKLFRDNLEYVKKKL